MRTRIVLAALMIVLAVTAVGCGRSQSPTTGLEPEPVPAESPATGSRLASGVYELADGTSQAIGTLEYRDLEGGFWAVVGGTAAEGNEGTVLVVIANADAFLDEIKALDGTTVSVNGTILEGASIHQAGPEIEATAIEAINDTPGPAE